MSALSVFRQLVPAPAKRWGRGKRPLWRNCHEIGVNLRPFAPPLLIAVRLACAPRLRILTWPGCPSRWQVLYKICALNGYRIVVDPSGRYDLAVHFAEGGACELPAHAKVLNRACTDITKAHVAAVFDRIFGYSLAVDPTAYDGQMVEKSDGNYTHDGRIVQGPIAPSDVAPDRVYQRLVDSVEGESALDLRTPLYRGEVPFVYVKRRPVATRFANENTAVEMRETREIYSPDELAALRRFGAAMGLDYGELDVLRDHPSGRIYVVDVANTPAGPPNGLPAPAARVAMRRLAGAFRDLVGTL